jgi:hypothetical protein
MSEYQASCDIRLEFLPSGQTQLACFSILVLILYARQTQVVTFHFVMLLIKCKDMTLI